MKKVVSLLLALCMALTLAACGSKTAAPAASAAASAPAASSAASGGENVELTVFAAASMTETLNQIIEMYKTVAPNVTIVPTYDSSGTLLKQIQAGAECDLFISAAQKQMNALDGSLADDAEKNPDKLDMIDTATRVNILENKVVLAVPSGNPAGIQSFQDLKSDKLKLLALGNSDVPVGSYSLDVLKYLGLDVTALEKAGKITYGSNVKEVTTQISQGTVDCGIVYATDAYSAGLDVVDTATKDMCKQVLYPAAVLKNSQHADAAKAFLDYLQTSDCSAVFEKVGFAIVQK
jgi:molybdenum ABC transporter, periplasmic molybdate-binding protein